MKFLRENGLSIVLFILFILTLVGQSLAGWGAHNQEFEDHGQPRRPFSDYLSGGAFLEETMENWESEFLQMAAFVLFTVFLKQKGSAESKDPDGKEEVDRDPRKSKNKPDAPWPVRKGGFILRLYEHSLSLAFLVLFLLSFYLHAVGGARKYNGEQALHGGEQVSVAGYFGTSQMWSESFQNWQSEFLSLWAMVVFSIFLRERGSPESKPVDAPHSATGGA